MAGESLSFLVDSVILIDHFNGIGSAAEFLADNEGRCAVSVITRAAVLTGFSTEEEAQALRLLDAFPTLEITVPVADQAARLRRDKKWKMPDALQAALAVHHKLRLATRNTKDFPPHRYSFAVLPYEI